MTETFNIYCDEGCRLEHDGIPVMVLGAACVPVDRVKQLDGRGMLRVIADGKRGLQ